MATPKFAHVVLQTSRKPQMRDFYCALLGAHVVFENELLTFITFDDEHHRIALLQPPGTTLDPRSPKAAGLNHTAYTIASLPELLQLYVKLEERGLTPAQPIQHGVTTSLYYRDPDGNFAEMQVDNFETPDQATGYMRGPEYAGDAVGVGFSPAKMLAALEAGTPIPVLKTRAWALEHCPGMPNPILELSR